MRRRRTRAGLKQAISEKGMTYAELGKRLGMSGASAHRKLNGKLTMTVDELERAAALLGYEIVLQRAP